jgi:hypothetical protein
VLRWIGRGSQARADLDSNTHTLPWRCDVLATVSRAVSDDRSQLREARVQAGQESHAPWRGGADGVDRVHLLARAGFGPVPGRRSAGELARLRSRSLAGTGWRFGASTLAVLPGNPCGARGQGGGAEATRRGRG